MIFLRINKFFSPFIIIFFIFACNDSQVFSFEKPSVKLIRELKNEYLGLFFQNNKIGYFHGSAHEAQMGDEKVFYLSGYAIIRIQTDSGTINTILKEDIILDNLKRVVFFDYKQNIGDSELNIKGVRRGEKLFINIESAGNVHKLELDSDYIPLASAGFIIWHDGIKEGKKEKFKVFVEALQKQENLIIEIGKKRIIDGNNVYPMRQKLGNIEITTEILENGDIYKEESIQGFTMKKLKKEEATKLDGVLSYYDLLAFSVIPVNRDLKNNVSQLEVEITGIDDNIKIPEGDYQKVEKIGNMIKVSVASKPIKRLGMENISKYLVDTPRIQKNSKEIVSLAKEIVKELNNDKEKAKAVVEWVNKNIKKKLKDKSSALEVLRDREGECEAHAVLTSALLRSLGIPAKVVGGVVYSRENKGFLYHAWNEVYIDGYFVPVDATFGQFPADATHIKLTSEENMEDVALFIGKLKINILNFN